MKTTVVLSVLVIIITPYCYSAAIEETTTDTNSSDEGTSTTTTTTTDGAGEIDEVDIEIEAQTVNIIRENKGCGDSIAAQGLRGPPGPQGFKGKQGEPGPPGGGLVYTRWGRIVCPNTTGTELVYKGLVAGSHYNTHGGGANYLCLTEDIKYLATSASSHSDLYATEYEGQATSSLNNHNAPCAVCHTSQRSSKLMIPGTTSCPTSWTEEYKGYLMAGYHTQKHSYNFECVDKDPETVRGEARDTNGALFYHVDSVCNVGLPCPPMVANRPITCVVCTK